MIVDIYYVTTKSIETPFKKYWFIYRKKTFFNILTFFILTFFRRNGVHPPLGAKAVKWISVIFHDFDAKSAKSFTSFWIWLRIYCWDGLFRFCLIASYRQKFDQSSTNQLARPSISIVSYNCPWKFQI